MVENSYDLPLSKGKSTMLPKRNIDENFEPENLNLTREKSRGKSLYKK